MKPEPAGAAGAGRSPPHTAGELATVVHAGALDQLLLRRVLHGPGKASRVNLPAVGDVVLDARKASGLRPHTPACVGEDAMKVGDGCGSRDLDPRVRRDAFQQRRLEEVMDQDMGERMVREGSFLDLSKQGRTHGGLLLDPERDRRIATSCHSLASLRG